MRFLSSKRREEKWMEQFLRAKRAGMVKKYIAPNKIICDIGCGYEAYLLQSLSKHFAYGYGLDKDVNSKFISTNIKLIKGDIGHEIKLESDSIDVVLMLAVIEHFDSYDKLIKECYRLLKPGGKILITTPTKKSKWLLELLAFKLKLLDATNMAEHKHYFDKQELASLLSANGFVNISTKIFQMGFNMLVTAQK